MKTLFLLLGLAVAAQAGTDAKGNEYGLNSTDLNTLCEQINAASQSGNSGNPLTNFESLTGCWDEGASATDREFCERVNDPKIDLSVLLTYHKCFEVACANDDDAEKKKQADQCVLNIKQMTMNFLMMTFEGWENQLDHFCECDKPANQQGINASGGKSQGNPQNDKNKQRTFEIDIKAWMDSLGCCNMPDGSANKTSCYKRVKDLVYNARITRYCDATLSNIIVSEKVGNMQCESTVKHKNTLKNTCTDQTCFYGFPDSRKDAAGNPMSMTEVFSFVSNLPAIPGLSGDGDDYDSYYVSYYGDDYTNENDDDDDEEEDSGPDWTDNFDAHCQTIPISNFNGNDTKELSVKTVFHMGIHAVWSSIVGVCEQVVTTGTLPDCLKRSPYPRMGYLGDNALLEAYKSCCNLEPYQTADYPKWREEMQAVDINGRLDYSLSYGRAEDQCLRRKDAMIDFGFTAGMLRSVLAKKSSSSPCWECNPYKCNPSDPTKAQGGNCELPEQISYINDVPQGHPDFATTGANFFWQLKYLSDPKDRAVALRACSEGAKAAREEATAFPGITLGLEAQNLATALGADTWLETGYKSLAFVAFHHCGVVAAMEHNNYYDTTASCPN